MSKIDDIDDLIGLIYEHLYQKIPGYIDKHPTKRWLDKCNGFIIDNDEDIENINKLSFDEIQSVLDEVDGKSPLPFTTKLFDKEI